MKQIPTAIILLILAGASCVNNPTTDTEKRETQFQVSLTEPEDGEEPTLADGEVLQSDVEKREAILTILKGVPSRPADEPLKFELVRAVDRELYTDVDDSDGPEQWITVAEVQDDDGNVLWFDRVNSLYQLLEYLQVVMDQQSALSFEVTQVLSFVSMQYPQLLEFGVKVPLGIEGGTQYVLKVPKLDGTLYEAYRVDLDELVANAEAPRVEGEVTTIMESGAPSDRIDVVIMGDGYTADQREKFDLDAQAIADRLVRTEPLATKKEAFNIHTVWTPSNEAGAGYDCTGIATLDRGCKRDLRDTEFETVFVLTALADRFNFDLQDTSDRVAMPLQVGKLFEAAASTPFDEIIMVSNTRRRSGFAGLYVSIVTAYDPRLEFPETAVHEFGHSFGVLGDEYMVEGDPCLNNEPRIPLPVNIASTIERDALKWSHWVADETELPTPPEADEGTVGAFEGAYNCEELHRPEHVCKMRSSNAEFCHVCAEQMIARIYSVLDPIVQEPLEAERVAENLVFRVPLRDEDKYVVQWLLDDEPVGEGAALELQAEDVPQDWTSLQAVVVEASGFVRAELPKLRQSHNWWIRR